MAGLPIEAEGGEVLKYMGDGLRRAETLEVPRPKPRGDGADSGAGRDTGPMHLLVDCTGLKLYGAGEWLVEKHGPKRRRSWRTARSGCPPTPGSRPSKPLCATAT